MTSANNLIEEQSNQLLYGDGNTSDDSLLFGTDNNEREPLLSTENRNMIESNGNINMRSRSLSVHCHIPDDKFDYSARNRLIVVLIICIFFMGIEIVGKMNDKSFTRSHRMVCRYSSLYFHRWYSIEFHCRHYRCCSHGHRCCQFSDLVNSDVFSNETTNKKTVVRLHSSRFD